MSRESTTTVSNELTGLISKEEEGEEELRNKNFGKITKNWWRVMFGLLVVGLVLYLMVSTQPMTLQQQQQQQQKQLHHHHQQKDSGLFPNDFVWGAATSSYQIEGAVHEDGRGDSIWDVFVHSPTKHNILDNSTADIACDHYHRVQQDIALMKASNIRAYRFSIAWPRIFPNGTAASINPQGIQFYNNLIDELIANDIQPWVTMHHWDLPQALQDRYGGWMDPQIIIDFGEYARTLYQHYGDRIKHWITINEPWTIAVNGYSTGVHAPGRNQFPATEPYIVAHHTLLAHARAYRIYEQEFKDKQNGMVGIANSGDYRYPLDANNPDDVEAAERAMLFQFGWFVEPLVRGEYPSVMTERLQGRLPVFTATEQEQILGSFDFFGLNYYSSLLASKPNSEATWGGYWADIFVDFQNDPEWKQNDMGWSVVPEGLYKMLLWVSHRYDFPLLFITENGTAEKEDDVTTALEDNNRQLFIENHLKACADAIHDGVNLSGYFAWSMMDNFEWQFGYQRRFGLYRVDFETLERTPKSSALWYRDIIASNGATLQHTTTGSNSRRSLKQRAPLPQHVLMGYASDCNAALKAVEEGVNIIAWAFVDIRSTSEGYQSQGQALGSYSNGFHITGQVVTKLNLTRIASFKQELDELGHSSVVHLASFGGWNGDHLDKQLSAEGWYETFKNDLGDLFDGIDWDLEGNDDLNSSNNVFSIDCLEKMGEISRMASTDGFYVTAAPPQSYLDIHGSSRFSRYVNLSDSSRQWHTEFHYFGRNVYAYLLAKYGQYIDLVSVQFYESYSRANQAVTEKNISPSKYLQGYVEGLATNEMKFFIDFAEDKEINLPSQDVSLPLSKLVFGFRNGWADSNEKAIFFDPQDIRDAWLQLKLLAMQPRGFMFWTIDEEGKNGIYLARDLGKILIRKE